MRKHADETYEQWADRVRQYEYGLALTKIANGIPVEEVMERMAKNITQKMLHPLFAEIRNIPIDSDALALSKKNYEDTYINKVGRAADHVDN